MELISRENIGDDNVHKSIFVGRLCRGLADYVSTLSWKVSEPSSSKTVPDNYNEVSTDSTNSMSENKAHIIFLNIYRSIHEIWIQHVVSNFEAYLLERFGTEEWNMEDIWTNLWIGKLLKIEE